MEENPSNSERLNFAIGIDDELSLAQYLFQDGRTKRFSWSGRALLCNLNVSESKLASVLLDAPYAAESASKLFWRVLVKRSGGAFGHLEVTIKGRSAWALIAPAFVGMTDRAVCF